MKQLILSNTDYWILGIIIFFVFSVIIAFISWVRRKDREVEKETEITYDPNIPNIRFEDEPISDKKKELLNKTHVEVESGVWVNKEQVPRLPSEVLGDIIIDGGNSTTSGLALDKDNGIISKVEYPKPMHIVGVDPYRLVRQEEIESRITIAKIVDGVMEYKKRKIEESVAKGIEHAKEADYPNNIPKDLRKNPLTPDEYYTSPEDIVKIAQAEDLESTNIILDNIEKKKNDLKEGEDDLLKLLLEYLKEK